MALTVATPEGAPTETGVPGNMKFRIVKITFDSSYASGGEALTATTLGFGTVALVIAQAEDSGYVAQYDYTNSKLALYEAGADSAALDEVTATTDVSAVVVRCLVMGR
jgi:hypothetical protein|tara:strand:- start:364 stop:687 length:324 start_codon:yes stop_codon:yes gene_type:complete